MKYVEYGKENGDVIILLHGGGLSWWNYRGAAEKLASAFRVILPVLDGHGNSDSGFSTIEANAAEIIGFIDEKFGGKVLFMGGLSLGGQVLMEILAQRSDICRFALIESALAIPSPMTFSMIKPAVGSCHGLIRRRWFSKLQFRALRIKQELFEDYFRDTCKISRPDMTAFMQANAMYSIKPSMGESRAKVHVYVGERENRSMRRSAEMICAKLPGSVLRILPGMYHGEFSINHADDYAKAVVEIIGHNKVQSE